MADITEVDYIWKNGEMIPWAEATTHVLSHSLHYGSGVFEGIRCYQNPETKKSYVFRLRDHMERLHRSCKISLIDLPYSVDELCDATIELIRKNKLPSCYIRPIVYRGYGVMGVDPTGAPTDVAIAVWPWDTYLGDGALDNGVAVGVSSWRQRTNNSIPPAVKATASYMNSILAKLEAKEHGYVEAIMLNEAGLVCEDTGALAKDAMSEATIKIHVGDQRFVATGEGAGPVGALDNALRMAIVAFYPEVADIELVDYKVRILDENVGTDAITRVVITTRDKRGSWGTVGVSENIIEASWNALVDSIEYGLMRIGE